MLNIIEQNSWGDWFQSIMVIISYMYALIVFSYRRYTGIVRVLPFDLHKFAIRMSFQWTEWDQKGQNCKDFDVKMYIHVHVQKIIMVVLMV